MNTRAILIVSDGNNHPHLTSSERAALVAKAAAFKAAGNIVLCVGLRAWGDGFALLNQIASGGFFQNVFGGSDEVQAAITKLLCNVSYFCAGENPPTSVYSCGTPSGPQAPDPSQPWDLEDGDPPQPPQLLPPVIFTPATGESGLDVLLSVPGHADAIIRYSMDGTAAPLKPSFNPPYGTLYEGGNIPVRVPEAHGANVCVKAIARKAGYLDSLVSQACYTPGTSITAQLSGLRWELPYTGRASLRLALCQDPPDTVATLTGDAGKLYNVVLRIRGVVEQFDVYVGGTPDLTCKGYQYVQESGETEPSMKEAGGALLVGGTKPAITAGNTYALIISDPPQTYWLNREVFPTRHTPCMKVDYQFTAQLRVGATVTLRTLTGDHMETLNNRYPAPELNNLQVFPLYVPGVAPYPNPSEWQFLQMDVVSVEEVPE